MSYLYLLLDIGSIFIPIIYSIFEKEFHFIQYFKKAITSITLVAIPFLIWDEIFTKLGVWGFNKAYILGIYLLSMPIEEWLFFFCIPYACLFLHQSIRYYIPSLKLSNTLAKTIGIVAIVFCAFMLVKFFGRLYTTVNLSLFILLMLYTLKFKLRLLSEYLPSFMVILIPFSIVNGLLTGSFIQDQVVWYNDLENMEIRFFTIPVEDFFYCFNLLFPIQILFDKLIKK